MSLLKSLGRVRRGTLQQSPVRPLPCIGSDHFELHIFSVLKTSVLLKSKPPLGLQRHSPPIPTLGPGIFPREPEVAPVFGSWNRCTAASSAGSRDGCPNAGPVRHAGGAFSSSAEGPSLIAGCTSSSHPRSLTASARTKSVELLCAQKAVSGLPQMAVVQQHLAPLARAFPGPNPRMVEASGTGSPGHFHSHGLFTINLEYRSFCDTDLTRVGDKRKVK